MLRRIIATYTVLCLLAVACFAPAPAVPTLVCRVTGQMMMPVAATPATQHSCCAVAAVSEAADETSFVLTSPGCCDLKYSRSVKSPVGVSAGAPELPVLAVLLPIPSHLFLPDREDVTVSYASARHDIPRGPPLRSVAPRGPPAFS